MKTVWACTTCRTANKGSGRLCPICGGKMENLGHCYRVPVKTDKRRWKRVDLFIEAKRARGMDARQSPTYHSNDSFNPPSLLPKAQRPNMKGKTPERAYRESQSEKESARYREELKTRLKARLSLTRWPNQSTI